MKLREKEFLTSLPIKDFFFILSYQFGFRHHYYIFFFSVLAVGIVNFWVKKFLFKILKFLRAVILY